jgi:hypothetical protein
MRRPVWLALALALVAIACGDGTTGESPDATSASDGGLPTDGPPALPGTTLTGTLRLIGQASHGGVTVRFEPGGATATTDAAGAFALAAPLGEGRLVIDGDGYHEEVPRVVVTATGAGIPVEGGALAPIVDLEVPRAHRLLTDPRVYHAVQLSPDGARIALRAGCAECASNSEAMGRLFLGAVDGVAGDAGVTIEINDFQDAVWRLGSRRFAVIERGPADGTGRTPLFFRLYDAEAAPVLLARIPVTAWRYTRTGDRAVLATPEGVEVIDLATGARTSLHRATEPSPMHIELPGSGEHVVFWTHLDDREQVGRMYVVPITGGEVVALTSQGSRWAVRIIGTPPRIVYGVRNEVSQQVDLWSSPVDRAAPTFHGAFRYDTVLSPDGKTLYLLHRDEDDGGRLTAIDTSSGETTVLSDEIPHPGGAGRLRLSPAGRYIYYPVVSPPGSETVQLAVRPANGGDERRLRPLLRGEASYAAAHFAAEDRLMVLAAGGAFSVFDLEAGVEHPGLAATPGPSFQTTPDGRHVLFIAGANLLALDVATRTTRAITGPFTSAWSFGVIDDRTVFLGADHRDDGWGRNPVTLLRVGLPGLGVETIDRDVLSYQAPRPDGAVVYVRRGSVGDEIRRFEGSSPGRLLAEGAYQVQFVRGGRQIVYYTSGRVGAILHILDADTGAIRTLGNAVEARLSPDETWLAFVSLAAGTGRTLHTVRVDGGDAAPMMSHVGTWQWLGNRVIATRTRSPAPFGFQDGAYIGPALHPRGASPTRAGV